MSSSPIRVLHIIKSLGRGGAEMLLPETLALHDRAAFEFHYIYFLPWKDQLVEAIRQAGGRVQCMSARNNVQILLQYSKLRAYIREHNIQVVHCHLPWAGFAGRLLHRGMGIPVIYTEHNKQERYHKLTFLLNKLTFNWQNLAIGVSDDVQQSIRKNIAPRVAVRTVLNGVNTERFVREPEKGRELRTAHGIPQDALVIGTIAVFRFQKRLVEWLEVASKIKRENERAFFIIVGDGPLKEEILARRKVLGLEDCVVMGGLQTEVRPWLSAMDIYMMSSVFEGLPIALLEAMSMQCAIASTDAGGIKEVVVSGRDGLLVPVDRWEDLPGCVSALADAGQRRLFGEKARTRVATSFSLRQMVAELEQCYRNVKS